MPLASHDVVTVCLVRYSEDIERMVVLGICPCPGIGYLVLVENPVQPFVGNLGNLGTVDHEDALGVRLARTDTELRLVY